LDVFSGFACEFVDVSQLDKSSKKNRIKTKVLGIGGAYTDLVLQHRKKLPASKYENHSISAVGISFTLEALTNTFPGAKEMSGSVPEELGCGSAEHVTVLLAYVGSGRDNLAMLRERYKYCRHFRAKAISADFAHLLTEFDLDRVRSPYVVIVDKLGEKWTVKHGYVQPGFWSSEKKMVPEEVVIFIHGLIYPQFNRHRTQSGPSFRMIPVTFEYLVNSTKAINFKETEHKIQLDLSRNPSILNAENVVVLVSDLEDKAARCLAAVSYTVPARNHRQSLELVLGVLKLSKDDQELFSAAVMFIRNKVQSKKKGMPNIFVTLAEGKLARVL